MPIQAGGVTFSRHRSLSTTPKSGGGGSVSSSEDLTPWQPSAGDPWDLKKVHHLGRRAGFGLRPEEAEKLLQVGHNLAIDIYLLVPHLAIPTRGTFLLPNGEVIIMSSYTHQVAAWLYLMNASPWQLQEKLALFCHDHFSIGIGVVRYAELMGRHINIFRALALGNFRDMLAAVGLDPGMLYFLDNRLSRAANPNENWARELKELYSMGVDGGYTEKDIQESARCFTGWTGVLDYAYFNPSTVWHDYGVKTLFDNTPYKKVIDNRALGRTTTAVAKDGLDVIDAILGHPSTAKFMVRKIWEYFVYEKPSQALVDKLAARWRQDNYEFRPLMETIFRSRAFFSAAAMRTLVKNPIEYAIGHLRNTATENISYVRTANRVLTHGLPLMNYPGPDGLPDGIAWINSQNVINRTNFAKELVERRRFRGRSGYLQSGLDPEREIRRKNIPTNDPAKIVDYFLELLVDGAVPPQVRNDLVAYMTKDDNGSISWNYPGPRGELRDEKLAHLLHLIWALPEAHIN